MSMLPAHNVSKPSMNVSELGPPLPTLERTFPEIGFSRPKILQPRFPFTSVIFEISAPPPVENWYQYPEHLRFEWRRAYPVLKESYIDDCVSGVGGGLCVWKKGKDTKPNNGKIAPGESPSMTSTYTYNDMRNKISSFRRSYPQNNRNSIYGSIRAAVV